MRASTAYYSLLCALGMEQSTQCLNFHPIRLQIKLQELKLPQSCINTILNPIWLTRWPPKSIDWADIGRYLNEISGKI